MSTQISIIIPVFHEGDIISNTLIHIRKSFGNPAPEIIVADGGPEQDSLDAVKEKAVKKISSPKGRGRQMNSGAAAAAGDILLFLHADTRLPDRAGEKIIRVLRKKHYAAGAFSLGIDSVKKRYRLLEKAANLRTRISRIPYGDQAFFIRKDIFSAAGGFRDIPIMEDVELMRRIKRKGLKIYIIPDPVMTSARRWEKEGLLYGMLRNRFLILLFAWGISPEKLLQYYRPHRGAD